MRKFVAALTGATLALSMIAQAMPANAAVAGYDSAYSGESDFVTLAPGQSNPFQVFFQNTGTTTWTVGTGSQVDLAGCQADKTTCNAQDTTEAAWNTGWLSSTRYATSTQTSVAPGGVATFKYTVTAPIGATAGTYRFNGDLVLAATGALIHPQGYYQDATIGGSGGAAVITSLTPATGTNAGGTTVVIAGSGFTCTPAFPTVMFSTTAAAVTSCGSTSVTAVSPAGAVGTVQVTVTNGGAGASNGLTYTYTDTTAPVFTSVTAAGNQATVTFSEPVCRNAVWAATDWTVTVNGVDETIVFNYADTADFIPACNATTPVGVSTSTLVLTNPAPNGSFVAVNLEAAGGAKLQDLAAVPNTTTAPRTNTTTAVSPETTAPIVITSTGTQGASVDAIKVTFSEPVYCTGLTLSGGSDFTLSDGNAATVDPSVTAVGTDTCGGGPATADSSFQLTLSGPLLASTTYTLTITPEANEIQDVVGNDLATPTTTTFTSGPADFTPPTVTDARLTANVGSTDLTEVGDQFTATFSEAMNTTTTADTIQVSDSDGTVVTYACGTSATCSFDTAATSTIITVTLTAIAPTTNVVGSVPGLQIPLTITALTGFADTSANTPNLPGSADRVIDYE